MKLGIMQPYFFPYLGYFDLIYSAEQWIIFDVVQYIRHGWMNRNRILHPKNGWQYIIVPVKSHPRETVIKDIEIDDFSQWQDKLLGQLQHYQKQAPFFKETISLVENCISDISTSLPKLNASILAKVCERAGIHFEYCFFSEMDVMLGEIHRPGDWALEISKALGAKEYINPSGGAHLFDASRFQEQGIKLTIQSFENMIYPCGTYKFVPALSIIDVLMWNSPTEIKRHLDGQKASQGQPCP